MGCLQAQRRTENTSIPPLHIPEFSLCCTARRREAWLRVEGPCILRQDSTAVYLYRHLGMARRRKLKCQGLASDSGGHFPVT
jgi:hypothetical protein